MTLRVRDPRAEIQQAAIGSTGSAPSKSSRARAWACSGASTPPPRRFWPVFERIVAERFHPPELHRFYKRSTWNVATPDEVADFVSKVDYAFVGVGG